MAQRKPNLFSRDDGEASYEFGFDAEDIPLMIEAVPLTADSILLIVTKVEYPEELDTRFSHFSEDMDSDDFDMDSYDDAMPHPPTAADDIFVPLFQGKRSRSPYRQVRQMPVCRMPARSPYRSTSPSCLYSHPLMI